MGKEAFYTIRTDGHMNGYASYLREDGYCETLGMLSHEQAAERLHAQGYEVVRCLPEEEFAAFALKLREQHREAVSPRPVTDLDIFCLLAEIMARREDRRQRQEIIDVMRE